MLTTGWVITPTNRLRVKARTQSWIFGLPGAPGAKAVISRVSGAPSTRKMGMTSDKMMWPTMCTEKTAGIFSPIPELIVTSRVTHPANHQAVGVLDQV